MLVLKLIHVSKRATGGYALDALVYMNVSNQTPHHGSAPLCTFNYLSNIEKPPVVEIVRIVEHKGSLTLQC